ATEGPMFDLFISATELANSVLSQLAPTINNVSTMLTGLVDETTAWTQGSGFQTFLEWVNSFGVGALESLLTALGNLGAGFGNLLIAFTPMAQGFVDGFLDMSERFRE